jgi:hypothetical protein
VTPARTIGPDVPTRSGGDDAVHLGRGGPARRPVRLRGVRAVAGPARFLPFGSITLLDQDAGAPRAAVRAIGPARLRAVNQPVRALIDDQVRFGSGLDLVYSIGLYDYLSARTAAALTARLWSALAAGGLLVAGNFADGEHADRHLLESGLDWYLNYRTAADLLALVDGLPGLAAADVRTDPTGSLHLLVARRAGA